MSELKTTEHEGSKTGEKRVNRITIRPTEFSVQPNDPFKNDLLDRKPAIESLTRIVGSAQSPYVISVDADWGSGKTAFLKMWCQHLEDEGYTVVKFNAWETDFADSPFQALAAEITQSLEQFPDSAVKKGIKNVRKLAADTAFALSKSTLRGVGTLLFPGAGPITVEFLIRVFEAVCNKPTKDPISVYQQTRDSLDDFKNSIGEVSAAVSDRADGKPLVVAIDELDRCRLTYAVELLETTKHIFLVENVVFILAINSTALAHSIKSLYGTGFDAERYFRRFFDLQFRLAEQDRESFVKELLRSTRLQDSIESQREEASWSFTLARSLLSSDGLSLRDAEQVAHRLGLVLSLLDNVKSWTTFCALIGLTIMVFQPGIYVRFLRGELSDQRLNEILSENLPYENPDLERIKPQIEAAVIALAQSRFRGQTVDFDYLHSPLIDNHRKVVETIYSDETHPNKEQQYSRDVLDFAGHFWLTLHFRVGGSTLIEALQCLELVLPDESSESE